MERIKSFDIPASFYEKLQKGEDYITKQGTIIPNEEVTIAGLKAKTYGYCADTIFDEGLVEKIKGVDLLYHEATFDKSEEVRAKETFHSTTLQAALIAKKARVKRLLIGHFSARYKTLDNLLDEARVVFPDSELAIEGKTFEILKT